jgi:hypothetical protein
VKNTLKLPRNVGIKLKDHKASLPWKVKLFLYRHADAKGDKTHSSCSFLTSALDGGEWSASHPGRALLPGMDPRSYCIGGCVGFWADLDPEARGKILCLCRGLNPIVQSVVRHNAAWATPAPVFTAVRTSNLCYSSFDANQCNWESVSKQTKTQRKWF